MSTNVNEKCKTVHLTWKGVDLNSPELCWTKIMSMAPLRVALLMVAMLDTTPVKKFMAVY